MKFFIAALLTGFSHFATAQNPIAIPDTLSGTSILLRLHADSTAFINGTKTFTNAFNSYSYLGPTLILNKGDFVSLTVENQLMDTSTVHWHGLHVPAVADGGPHTVILPNTSWLAQFTVKNNAATYWYHPHLHMRTGEQAMRGAAGLIIVRDSVESTLNLPRTYGVDDFPIIVQTQQFDSMNQVLWRGMNDSILLVNGTVNPQINLPRQVVRLRLLNASQSRNFNFGFSGNIPFSIIASDGGLLQAPVNTTRIRLSPGERAEILIDLLHYFGQTIYLMSYASEFPMGVHGGPLISGMDSTWNSPLNGVDYTILRIDVVSPTSTAVNSMPSSLVQVTPLLEAFSNETRWITITPQSSTSYEGPFYFNGQSFDMMRIDYTVPLNHIEVWSISNQSMMAHPFHIHDVQFFILDRDGIIPPPQELGFKDDVLLLPNETVRLIMKFEDYSDPAIPYMYHCHILMHEDDGMMGQFLVSSGTGIEEGESSNAISVWPNPVTQNNFKLQLPSRSVGKKCHTEIWNVFGKIISTQEWIVDEQNQELNVSRLDQGTYIIRTEIDGQLLTTKFLKLK